MSLAPYLDNTDSQDLTLASNTLSLTGDATTVSLAAYLDNTDAQALTFTSPNLSISGGNSVNLSAINTDAQTLSFTSPNLSISGGNSISLSAINTDSQDLTLASNTLSLTGDATTVSLAPYLDNTDAQTLTFTPATSTLAISGGNSVTVTATGTAGGDLNGSYPNPTVDGLQGRAVAATLPSNGQVLEWNGSAWAPGTDDSGGGGVGGSGTSGQVAYWSSGTAITGNSNLVWDEKDNLLGVGVTPKTNLHVGGSHAVSFTVSGAGNYDIKPKDYVVFAPAATNNIFLPEAAEIPGRLLIIRSTDQDKGVTLRAINGKDLIDGLSIMQLFDRAGEFYTVTLISNGTDWFSISKSTK